ncbi:hypothetical protein D3C84_901190 [compost metagenome]
MHGLAFVGLRYEYSQSHRRQAVLEKVLFHGERGAEQADGQRIGVNGRLTRRVGDVQEGNVDCGLNLPGNLVHGVGAQHHAIGAASLQALRRIHQNRRRIVPAPGVLGLFDRAEVDAVHQQFCRTQRPEAVTYLLVDQAIVLGAGLPAHPAD